MAVHFVHFKRFNWEYRKRAKKVFRVWFYMLYLKYSTRIAFQIKTKVGEISEEYDLATIYDLGYKCLYSNHIFCWIDGV